MEAAVDRVEVSQVLTVHGATPVPEAVADPTDVASPPTPRDGPQTPQRSERPGEAGALLDILMASDFGDAARSAGGRLREFDDIPSVVRALLVGYDEV